MHFPGLGERNLGNPSNLFRLLPNSINPYPSVSPGVLVGSTPLNPGGVAFLLFLVLIWYETIAYTCNLSALDFVSGR